MEPERRRHQFQPLRALRAHFLWEELLVVLVGGRLYALAHGVRQKVAHLGVAASAAVGL